jgi:hypothetical protein
MLLGSTLPLTDISTRNHAGFKGMPACKADLSAICERVVEKMWENRHRYFAVCFF